MTRSPKTYLPQFCENMNAVVNTFTEFFEPLYNVGDDHSVHTMQSGEPTVCIYCLVSLEFGECVYDEFSNSYKILFMKGVSKYPT